MKATITDGKLQIEFYELTESLSEEDRETFMRSVIFQEETLQGVVNTLTTDETFPGFWNLDLAHRLRQQVVTLMPNVVQELVGRILRENARSNEQLKQYRSAFLRLEQHWPQSVTPNECHALRPEHCTCAFNRSQVAEFLNRELGDGWESEVQS